MGFVIYFIYLRESNVDVRGYLGGGDEGGDSRTESV